MAKKDETPTEAAGAANPFAMGGVMAGAMGDGMAMIGRWSAGPYGWLNAASAAKAPESPMEMWLSLFPTSPYFGVKWVWQDMAANMQDMAGGMAGAMSGGLAGGATPGAVFKPGALSAVAEAERLKPAEIDKVLKKGAALSGEAKAKQIVEQGDEANETVAVDVAKTVAAAKPAKARAKDAAKGDARAAAEKAALDNVGVGALSDLSAVGGVAAAFSADLGEPAKPAKKADLRVVGGSDAEEAAPAPKKPKGLMSKKPAKVDDLKLIRGVGPRLEKLLNEAGVYQFKQIANFTDVEFAWLDEALSTFKGRALRDKWREQAAELMKT